ncbi:MAG TPA: S8 family serine peptidase [Pyrinomonadaceae bacterium]|jgi:subtilisin family serine protease|nr:S8 family serine peptidase [Pyrinomonadaceae bacterium]
MKMVRHNSLLTCSVFLWLCLIPAFASAQTPKRSVTSAAELPRFVYDVPEKLIDLLNDEAAYKTFAVKVRADLEGVLRDYEIKDETTLKQIYKTLAYLDMQEGKLDSVLERIRLISELESKPELKLYPLNLFEIEAIAKAQKQSGTTNGTNYQHAFRRILTEMFGRLPASFYEKIKLVKTSADFLDDKLVPFIIESDIAPKAKKNGNKLSGDLASQVIEAQLLGRFFVPLADDMRQAADAYLVTHKAPEKVNVWTNRVVTLTDKQKLTPVVVAVWDTGVDPTVFPNQMFVNPQEKANGKDNDGNGFAADIYGIGFDEQGQYAPAPLFAPKEADLKQFSEWIKEQRVSEQFIAGVETEETRALKLKMQTATAEQGLEQQRLYNLFSNYSHGTAVAGVAVAGNPAARILNARSTWRDQSGQPDSIHTDEQWARAFAASVKAFVAYFKKHNVRVVNMSWSMTRIGIERNLEMYEPKTSAAERKIAAGKNFAIIKTALLEAFRHAPKILFVVSAGNKNSDADFDEAIPASLELPNLITIGSVDESGAAANSTSFGKTVTLYAQGVHVEAPNPGGEKLKFNGTSAAAPQVANLAAKLFALNPKLTVSQAIQLIRGGADISSSDKRLKLINPKRSVELLTARRRR